MATGSCSSAVPAWDGNPTWERFVAFAWHGPRGRLLVAVNFGRLARPVLRPPLPSGSRRPRVLAARPAESRHPVRARRQGPLCARSLPGYAGVGISRLRSDASRGVEPLTLLDGSSPGRAPGALPTGTGSSPETTAGTALRDRRSRRDATGRPRPMTMPGRRTAPFWAVLGAWLGLLMTTPAAWPDRGSDAAGGGGADATGSGGDQAPGLPGSPVRRGLVGPAGVDLSKTDDFWDRLKFIPLEPGRVVWLTLAGRCASGWSTSINSSSARRSPTQSDAYLLSRIMFSVDLHVTPVLPHLRRGEERAVHGPRSPGGKQQRVRRHDRSPERLRGRHDSPRRQAPASRCAAADRSCSSAPSVW